MKFWSAGLASVLAAIAFYTCIPVPAWTLDFRQVARLAPLIGLGMGALLGLLDHTLQIVGMPILTRSAVIVVAWVALTGGLHLDGAMDTADGLAVTDPKRRLEVMVDSHTGAFGAIAAIALLLLKTVALSELLDGRWFLLPLVAGWGRWAQQVAIARYPYLKPTGKGAFHKAAIQSWRDVMPSLLMLLLLSLLPIFGFLNARWLGAGLLSGGAIALVVPAWFTHKLGGHTGDTYGAVVEWTEAILLMGLTVCQSHF
jgi:adenosylcobinamide-GDP ribazoletransferase